MIYTDGTHLITTGSLDNLHDFAHKMGLRREWFQNHGKYPHYDLTTNRAFRRALDAGAKLVSSKDIIKLLSKMPIISFSWTTPALIALRKTATRRNWNPDYAKRFKKGSIMAAYNKSPRIKGQRVGIIKLIDDPVFELLSLMPDSDFEAEGFAFLSQNPHLLPKTMPYDVFWEGFCAWRDSGGSMWIVRFEVLEVTPI